MKKPLTARIVGAIGNTCTMATLNMTFARVGMGGFLDRINKINRIMRVRERNYEQFHSPTPTIFSNYLLIL